MSGFRSFLLSRLRRINLRKFSSLYGEHPDYDSGDNERKAEHMAHINHHITYGKKSYGRLLGKLQKASASEAEGNEDAQELSRIHLVEFLFIEEEQDEAQNHITQSLIKHSRMLRQGVPAPLENHSPREGGMITVNLGVEEVAEPDASAGKTHYDY